MEILYKKLEFDKIKQQVASFASSECSYNQLLSSTHFTEYKTVKDAQDKLRELVNAYNDPTNKLNVSKFYDISDYVTRATKKDVLPAIALYEVGVTVSQYFAINDILAAENDHDNKKFSLVSQIFTLTKLADPFYIDIMRYFDCDGNISSKASPELSRIRKELSQIDAQIMHRANEILADYKKKNVIMTDNVTIRDGLPCIGVKPTFKHAIPGMIIDSSSSGQTIFIVPSAVLQIYNDGKLLRDAELAEINRILKSYCLKISDQAEVLHLINKEMVEFDCLNAKARFTINREYCPPKILDNGQINLLNAKNPFLSGKIVPLNLWIGDKFNTLIITGPNTGGKTVALKTTGLCVLLSQWGVGIPADDNSSVSVFEHIFVDIGDDQSIQASLSTFSSHIKNIANIIDIIDESYKPNAAIQKASCLVLIDELGTGTDPTEGEALAISIIKHLRDKNAISVVTSHFNGLKYFATQEKLITNGAMDFDVDNDCPTYRLKIGIPGSSKAIDISRKLGLSMTIIDDAQSILSHGFFEIDKIIENLNTQQKRLDSLMDENEKLKATMENKLAQANDTIANAKEKQRQLTDLITNQKKDFLHKARKEFEHLIKEIKDNNASKESIKKSHDFIDKLDVQIQQNDKYLDRQNEKKQEQIANCINVNLKSGDNVLIISKNIKGTVVEQVGKVKNGIASYLIQAGIIKIKVAASDLQFISQAKNNFEYIQPKKVSFVPDTQTMSLDIRGMRCDEAERKLDDFIDSSMLNNYGEIRIIHGMGTGALRDFVNQYLRQNSLVVDYGYEKDAGGGLNYGVTEVKLR